MKFQRYKVVTTLLVLYALFMSIYFGRDLINSGQTTRFFVTLGAEAVVIVLAFFALRRKDRLRNNKDR